MSRASTMPGQAKTAPLVIPVFLPHAGCPHRCTFCNQRAVTGQAEPDPAGALREIGEKLALADADKASCVEIAFFGGNFLGTKPDIRLAYLEAAGFFCQKGLAAGIRFSTRPETICPSSLKELEGFNIRTVEIGVQSFDESVLAACCRGHSAEDSRNAAGQVKNAGYSLGIQLMVGLPEQSRESAIQSARQAVALCPDFVRVYPTLVLEQSPLASLWRKGAYKPLSLEEAVSICAGMLAVFVEAGIPVARMGLCEDPALSVPGAVLAGPRHPAFGHLAQCALFLAKARQLLEGASRPGDHVRLAVHPASVSRIRGHGNANVQILKKEFSLKALEIRQ
ncbi:MAG: radical SAM protein, partial [Desulfatibacillaceae bacterium]|nr:radical SAM protein [Desulfatibacillaceae bacterium]